MKCSEFACHSRLDITWELKWKYEETIFWDLPPQSLVEVRQLSSETCTRLRRHIPEGSTLHSHCRE
jgi:hypothetical protein